jgi:hypothetical protein
MTREMQYEGSGHYRLGNYAYANRDGCADCHTHEGFMARLAGGWGAGLMVPDASPPNCRTCHRIHETYTKADYGLRINEPVTLLLGGGTVDFGSGNICASCHLSRAISPMPVLGGPDVTVTSSRYGGHHSPVADILGGTGLFEFAGPVIIDGPFVHGNRNVGCPMCHMSAGYGDQAGGHTFALDYDRHGSMNENLTGCLEAGCHASLTGFDDGGFQSDIEARLEALATLLRKAGIMAAAPSVSSRSGTYPADIAAAFLNWQLIYEDKSLGIHNPPYISGILRNTILRMEELVQ